ncbi:hypothetical protein [Pseudomonas benzopyrenica]|uniref:hypothetical protein n=1 Tax=Pseudomonas benzopyrenica TaxID=2993566 RepID=UPI0022806ED0|nr:hypothetical protein [Pseudomonas benzopyrenica]MDC7832363.1 hypothetical protein [Pseudomonas benzopyrenica]
MHTWVLLISIYGPDWTERARPKSAEECFQIGREITNDLNRRKNETGAGRNSSFKCIKVQ